MSIFYLVEGKIKTHFKGDIKVYSKGDIVFNSGTSVTQKGDETGVSYGKPDVLNDNDRPVNDIDVTLNLFFDGTQNNKTNTMLGAGAQQSNHKDDSYTNDFSNVAKGYDATDANAERQVTIYVEGIGTVDGKRDKLSWLDIPNNKGIPFGTGDRGIEAKVTRGCIKAAEEIYRRYKNKEISLLKVNVFGFSRGAAAARHFVHICHQSADIKNENDRYIRVSPPKDYEQPEEERKAETTFNLLQEHKDFVQQHGYFGACLVKEQLNIKRIEFNFAGLYDTVASYGANHKGMSIGGLQIKKDDSQELNLDMVKKCRVVIHFATLEEFRENFSLTNIRKSGIRGVEFFLPGVHSDIGGGYTDASEEHVLIYKGSKENCLKYKDLLVEEGWYKDREELEVKEVKSLYSGEKFHLIGKRILSNGYNKIPLLKMIEYSKQFSVVYQSAMLKKLQITDPLIQRVSSQLSHYFHACHSLRNDYVKRFNKGETVDQQEYLQRLDEISYLSYVDSQDLKALRNGYLHWSADIDKIGMAPAVEDPAPITDRKRHILEG